MSDTKAFGIVDVDIKAADPDDDAGMFEAILSAPTLDRDGEVIDAKAFEPLPDHITIDIDHGMSVATTVGSGVPFYDGDLLKFRGTFSSIPRAQEVRTLVAEGHIRKMSVAFMNAKREDDPDDERPHIRRAELLNAAIVPIPSNREASILAAKAHAAVISDERLAANSNTYDATAWAAATASAPSKSQVVGYIADTSTGTATTTTGNSIAGSITISTATDPEPAAAPAAAAPAEVSLDPKALASLAEAEALLA